MKKISLWLFMLCLFSGCGKSQPVVDLNEDGPLSVEQWKEMDVLVKYELETFERLQETDPKLKKKRLWDKFMKDVIVPERKKDIPSNY